MLSLLKKLCLTLSGAPFDGYKEIKMNKNIQKLQKEIFDSMKNNMEEKDVEAIIERSVIMTFKVD